MALRIVCVVAIFFMSCATAAFADSWKGRLSVEVAVPDTFTMKDARDLAVHKLKVKAANEAGSIVIHRQKLEAGEIKDIVEVVASTDAAISDIKESVRSEGENVFMRMDANVTVDLDELAKTVSLVRENDRLRSSLTRVQEAYGSLLGKTQMTPFDLTNLKSIEERTRSALTGKNILALADELKNERDKQRRALEEQFAAEVKSIVDDSKTKIYLKNVIRANVMSANVGGDGYPKEVPGVVMTVDVDVWMDTTRFIRILDHYFILKGSQPDQRGFVEIVGVREEFKDFESVLWSELSNYEVNTVCGGWGAYDDDLVDAKSPLPLYSVEEGDVFRGRKDVQRVFVGGVKGPAVKDWGMECSAALARSSRETTARMLAKPRAVRRCGLFLTPC